MLMDSGTFFAIVYFDLWHTTWCIKAPDVETVCLPIKRREKILQSDELLTPQLGRTGQTSSTNSKHRKACARAPSS